MLKISVVTVCYNHAQFVEDTIRSVLTQDHPNIEYIVIDGGSTDGSAEIIKKYSDRLAYWCSEPDGGQTDALKKGFSKATGDILCWINSDDQLEPGALSEVAAFFEQHPEAQVVTGDHIKMNAQGIPMKLHREIPFNRFIWNYTYNYTAQTSTFWRRALYEDVGGMNSDFNMGMDTDLFSRFSERTFMYKTRGIWSRFRLHNQQKTQLFDERSKIERRLILERYAGPQPVWQENFCRAAARIFRIVWRLVTGCYFARIPNNKNGALKWK
jgi:glycosyltransferase involved in cell wall biosynthesis